MRPTNLEIAYAFMLCFQEKNRRPPSLSEMVKGLPFWNSRATAQRGRNKLRAQGLVALICPGGYGRSELWAIDRGEKCNQCGEWTEVSNVRRCITCVMEQRGWTI